MLISEAVRLASVFLLASALLMRTELVICIVSAEVLVPRTALGGLIPGVFSQK